MTWPIIFVLAAMAIATYRAIRPFVNRTKRGVSASIEIYDRKHDAGVAKVQRASGIMRRATMDGETTQERLDRIKLEAETLARNYGYGR